MRSHMEQFDCTDSPLHLDDRGSIRVIGSRFTLDTLVHKFQVGNTPEDLHQGFPSLKQLNKSLLEGRGFEFLDQAEEDIDVDRFGY